MSESGLEMGLYAQDDAIRAAAAALHAVLPPDGDHVEHHGLYLAQMNDTVTVVVSVDGRRESVAASPDVLTAFAELRRVMYTPGLGTWFSVSMTVSADWHAQTRFNYDQDPVTGRDPGGIAFVMDLATYPIDEDKRPEWLKRYVAQGVAELDEYEKKSGSTWVKRRLMDAGIGIDLSDWGQVLSASLGKVMVNQLACDRLVVRQREWHVDFTRGILAFGGDEYPVQFLGTVSSVSNTWLWGWENINHFPDNVVVLAQWLREVGVAWNLEPLMTASFEISEMFTGHTLSTVAAAICEQQVCYYCGPTGSGSVACLLFSGLPDEVFAPIAAMEFIQTTMRAMNQYPIDHTIFVKSFLYQNGTSYDEDGDAVVAHFDQDVRITFEQTGDVRHISNIQAVLGGH